MSDSCSISSYRALITSQYFGVYCTNYNMPGLRKHGLYTIDIATLRLYGQVTD